MANRIPELCLSDSPPGSPPAATPWTAGKQERAPLRGAAQAPYDPPPVALEDITAKM